MYKSTLSSHGAASDLLLMQRGPCELPIAEWLITAIREVGSQVPLPQQFQNKVHCLFRSHNGVGKMQWGKLPFFDSLEHCVE